MEKKKIILLSSCIEKENFGILNFPETSILFEYHTTRLIESSLRQRNVIYSGIIIDDLSSDEMIRFLDFMDKTDCLIALGLNDSSAIFYALTNNISIFVSDNITLRICNLLGINYITEQDFKKGHTPTSHGRIQNKKNNINNEVEISNGSPLSDKHTPYKTDTLMTG